MWSLSNLEERLGDMIPMLMNAHQKTILEAMLAVKALHAMAEASNALLHETMYKNHPVQSQGVLNALNFIRNQWPVDNVNTPLDK